MLYLIDPIPIGDNQFVSSNVLEDDYPVWSATSTYVRGNRVIVRDTHKIYQAVAPTPSTGPRVTPQSDLFHAETNPAGKWVEVGATARWLPFDGKISAYVRGRGLPYLLWRLAPGTRADSVALFGLQASHVRLEVQNGTSGDIIWAHEQSAIDLANITDGWDFFNNPPAYHTEMVFRGVPMTADTHLRVFIYYPDGEARVSEIVVGREVEIGTLLLGAGTDIQDYSRKERNEFGDPIIVRRAYADVSTYPVLVTAGRENFIRRTLAGLRSTPAVFHAGQDLTARGLTVYGFYKGVPVTLSSPTHSQLNIEVEGLT